MSHASASANPQPDPRPKTSTDHRVDARAETTSDTRAIDPGHRRRTWLAVAVIVTAQLMVVLDATIVNIALPAAQADLAFGDHDRQWIVTAYALAFGSLLLLGGRLSDRFGQRRAFIYGLAGFALASALGGLAPNLGLLIVARAAQGAFGALLAPAALSLISTTFTDAKERAKAFGVFGAVSASGGAIGLLLGGVLTEYLTWRWCMFVNIIFAVVAIAGAITLLPRTHPTTRSRMDVPGVLTITVGLVAIVYGFARVETAGWSDALVLISLALGLALVAWFVAIERRSASPLLPLRVVLDRVRGGAMLALGLISIGLFGLFLFLTYYLQVTLGFTALQTGFAFVPLPLAIIVSSNLIGATFIPRFGPRVSIVTGSLVAAGGLVILQALSVDGSYWAVVLPSLVTIGLGVGLAFSAGISAGTAGVDRSEAGVASAAVNMAQQVGGSIGTALLSSLYGGAVLRYAQANPAMTGQDLSNAAAVNGYHLIFAVSAAFLVATAVVGALLVRSVRDRPTTETSADQAPVVMH